MRHSEATKALIRQRAYEAHERLKQGRGGYITPEGKALAKAKRDAHLTEERRKQYSKDTEQARELAVRALKMTADRFARRHLPKIIALQRSGLGLRAIAEAMNDLGLTSRCGRRWTDQTVRQILKRRPVPTVRKLDDEVFGQPQSKPKPAEPQIRIIGWNAVVSRG